MINPTRERMMALLKQIAARLPSTWQADLKRIYFRRQIRRGVFRTDEPEYDILPSLITSGDWAIDIGANVGQYTKRFSELVGPRGRVIAFEPVPATFSLLAANIQYFAHPNVTLINAAASDKSHIVGMSIPEFSTGLANYYQAHLSASGEMGQPVIALSLDSLCFDHRIALVKIDVEGHEALVLAGMQRLLKKYLPVLIIETGSKEVITNLASLGYVPNRLENSPNVVFKPNL
jgi:FkbM family methyltransferase